MRGEEVMTDQEAIKDLREEIEKCYEQCEGACSRVENGKCKCRDAIILSIIENK